MVAKINADVTNGVVITSDTSGELELQANGVTKAKVTANGLQDANGNSLRGGMYRNLIINGDMQIAQRGTSSAGEGATEGFKTVDRWNYTTGGTATDGRFTLTQDTADAPKDKGFGYCTKFDCTTADTSIAAGEGLIWRTKLEGQTLQAIKKGTASAEQITLSFWAKGTAATYAVELHDEDNNRHNTQKFTITSSWQKFTLTFAADTTGTFNNDNGASLGINFWLHAGSNYTSGTFTSNTWATRTLTNIAVGIDSFYSSTANEFFLTGIQLEIGEGASNFEFLPYDVQLQRCQRYYEETDPDGRVGLHGYIKQTNTKGRVFWNWKVKKRSAPTLSVGFVTAGLFTLRYGDAGTRNCSNSQVTLGLSTIDCCTMDIEIAETMLSGYGLTCDVRGDLSGNTRLIADAEL